MVNDGYGWLWMLIDRSLPQRMMTDVMEGMAIDGAQ